MSDSLNFDDLFDDDAYEGGDLVGKLRKALKAQQKANKEQADELATVRSEFDSLKKTANSKSLASLLEAKGAKPSLAKYMGDTEASEEAVDAWLAENGEDFGWKPKSESSETPAGDTTPPAGTPGLTPEMEAALAAMARVENREANAAPGLVAADDKMEDFLARVNQNASSFEDVEKALGAAGLFRLPSE